jgi:uncharacterized SAM-binding protein YcdF (DUF218 family)
VKLPFLLLALPPNCFLYLALLGLLIAPRYRRLGYAATCVGLLTLALLALPVVSNFMLVGLEQGLPLVPPANDMPQAIVILGGDLTRVAEAPGAMSGRLTLDRLRAGAALQRRTGLPVLVTGGVVQPDRPAVADIMARSLREDFGVPVKWVENASVDTWQNASLSAEILQQQNIHSVYVVTQAWHLRRAVIAFHHAGLTVTAAPTSLEPPLDPDAFDFMPHALSWESSYYALHEWIGCLWYAMR